MCFNSSSLEFFKTQLQKANFPQDQFAKFPCSFELFIKFTKIHIDGVVLIALKNYVNFQLTSFHFVFITALEGMFNLSLPNPARAGKSWDTQGAATGGKMWRRLGTLPLPRERQDVVLRKRAHPLNIHSQRIHSQI